MQPLLEFTATAHILVNLIAKHKQSHMWLLFLCITKGGEITMAKIKKRDYKKEYAAYHGKPEQIKNRSKRNSARRIMKVKVGDPREVDHKKPLSKGGTNAKSNLRVVTRKTNRRKGATI